MNSDIVPIVAMILSLSPVSIFLILFYMTRHKERMFLIEKGLDASILFPNKKYVDLRFSLWLLRIGFFGIGISIGTVLTTLIVDLSQNTQAVDVFVSISSIFFCAGLSLVAAYFLERKIVEKHNN